MPNQISITGFLKIMRTPMSEMKIFVMAYIQDNLNIGKNIA